MKLFLDFFRQKVPKDTRDTPYYYHAMKLIDQMLIVYFLVCSVLILWSMKRPFWPPPVLLASLLLLYYSSEKISARLNLLLHTVLLFGWSTWFVVDFGWGVGGQHMLIVLVLLIFFCLYEHPVIKLLYFVALLTIRMGLYQYTSRYGAMIPLDDFIRFLIQIVNTFSVFLILACCCIFFSSNLQESERQLLLKNEQLHIQAETDPLTRLINRRGFLEIMNRYVEDNPEAMYCVAIADIDFFKRVNDTYGHNCGDYVLQKLSALFMERSLDRYFVSRWGGEEFCFFFPGVNIDEAGSIVTELLIEVRKLQLSYEGHCFSITLTAGVEENDYRSPLKALIESADRKLYRGKQNGRDQIVF